MASDRDITSQVSGRNPGWNDRKRLIEFAGRLGTGIGLNRGPIHRAFEVLTQTAFGMNLPSERLSDLDATPEPFRNDPAFGKDGKLAPGERRAKALALVTEAVRAVLFPDKATDDWLDKALKDLPKASKLGRRAEVVRRLRDYELMPDDELQELRDELTAEGPTLVPAHDVMNKLGQVDEKFFQLVHDIDALTQKLDWLRDPARKQTGAGQAGVHRIAAELSLKVGAFDDAAESGEKVEALERITKCFRKADKTHNK